MTIDFNVEPYYDDFNTDNGFYRILFRPGRAVQTRELTQLQTILQNQVSSVSDHFFQKGAQVLPGQVALDTVYTFVKIEEQFNGVDVDISNFLNKTVVGQTSGVTGMVVNAVVLEGLERLFGRSDLTH